MMAQSSGRPPAGGRSATERAAAAFDAQARTADRPQGLATVEHHSYGTTAIRTREEWHEEKYDAPRRQKPPPHQLVLGGTMAMDDCRSMCTCPSLKLLSTSHTTLMCSGQELTQM